GRSPYPNGVSSTREFYDRAAARYAAARRAKPSPARFGNRHAGSQSAQDHRFDGLRAGRRGVTNYGGFWGHAFADPGMPMPQPMPTPMPMPGGAGGMHVDMHETRHETDPAVLRAFRAFIRDDNRCVRNIGARVLGNHRGSESYNLFIGMLKDARADFRETGALGLGELEDSRAIN